MTDTTTCVDPFCAEHSPLMKATFRFWVCPVKEHRDRRDIVTVEWHDGIAHCTHPECGQTSAPVTASQTDRQPDPDVLSPTAHSAEAQP